MLYVPFALLTVLISSDPVTQEPTWLDVDGDGDRDALLLGSDGTLQLLAFESSTASFADVTESFGLDAWDAVGCVASTGDPCEALALGRADGLRLLRLRDGRFVDETTEAGLAGLGPVAAVTWVDLARSGKRDLYVLGTSGERQVFASDGRSGFVRVALDATTSPGLLPGAPGLGGSPSSAGSPTTAPAVGATPRVVVPPQAPVGPGASGGTTTGFTGSTTLGPETLATSTAVSALCATSIEDTAGGQGCLQASSVPTLGMLYPISNDLYVDAGTGWVGVGTTSPTGQLDVRPLTTLVGPVEGIHVEASALNDDAFGVRAVARGESGSRAVLGISTPFNSQGDAAVEGRLEQQGAPVYEIETYRAGVLGVAEGGRGVFGVGNEVTVPEGTIAGVGVYGFGAGETTVFGFGGGAIGVYGEANGDGAIGVSARNASPNGIAVKARSINSGTLAGLFEGRVAIDHLQFSGDALTVTTSAPAFTGIRSENDGVGGYGIQGVSLATTGPGIGVQGVSTSPDGIGGFFQNTAGGDAGVFGGRVVVQGALQSVGPDAALASFNPNNQNASVVLGWLNDVARIRVGGSGAGSGNGFDVQGTGNTSFLRVLGNGNVGIGDSTPSEKLDVAGNVRCVSLTQTSDARLKREVRDLEDALAQVRELRGVSYAWDLERFPEGGAERQLGFLAQEVREVLPEAVHEDEEGQLAVAYTALVPVLTEALRELDAELVAEREARAALEARLARLEAALLSAEGGGR